MGWEEGSRREESSSGWLLAVRQSVGSGARGIGMICMVTNPDYAQVATNEESNAKCRL